MKFWSASCRQRMMCSPPGSALPFLTSGPEIRSGVPAAPALGQAWPAGPASSAWPTGQARFTSDRATPPDAWGSPGTGGLIVTTCPGGTGHEHAG